MRADLPAGLDPEPSVFEVQQHIFRGPKRSRVPEHGGADREETRVRRRLQLRAHGHRRRGTTETGGRWRPTTTAVAAGSGSDRRRCVHDDDGNAADRSRRGRGNRGELTPRRNRFKTSKTIFVKKKNKYRKKKKKKSQTPHPVFKRKFFFPSNIFG